MKWYHLILDCIRSVYGSSGWYFGGNGSLQVVTVSASEVDCFKWIHVHCKTTLLSAFSKE